jgi:hypothetical protein
MLANLFGTVWFTVLVFISGAVVGMPLWNWVRKYFPWNK